MSAGTHKNAVLDHHCDSFPTMSSITKVPTVRLGNSGLQISKIILGMMSYGSSKWQPWVLDGDDACRQHVKACLDRGIFTFDTADVYSNGQSEEILGRVLKDLKVKREDVVILTKCYFPVQENPSDPIGPPKKPNQGGLNRKHIFDAIKASLKRLDMDYVDVLQCHRFDRNTPIEETMHALHDVVQAGYARSVVLRWDSGWSTEELTCDMLFAATSA